jgi:hypothetical protein
MSSQKPLFVAVCPVGTNHLHSLGDRLDGICVYGSPFDGLFQGQLAYLRQLRRESPVGRLQFIKASSGEEAEELGIITNWDPETQNFDVV